MSRTKPALDHLARQTLIALYELCALGRPVHAGALAAEIGASTLAVGEALCALDALGLVWLSRCALTMPGLALGARLARQRQRGMRRHAA